MAILMVSSGAAWANRSAESVARAAVGSADLGPGLAAGAMGRFMIFMTMPHGELIKEDCGIFRACPRSFRVDLSAGLRIIAARLRRVASKCQ
jgi:hypothetical protein